jgi:hypothetical protein
MTATLPNLHRGLASTVEKGSNRAPPMPRTRAPGGSGALRRGTMRGVKWLVRILFGTLFMLVLFVAGAVLLAFDDAPLLAPAKAVSAADIERAKRLLERHDPRKQKGEGLRQAALSQADLEALLNHAARALGQGSARVVLRSSGASLQFSTRIERSPIGPWLNVDAQLRETSSVPAFESLRIGNLPIPGWLADFALEQFIARFGAGEPGRLASEIVQRVRFTPGAMQVAYQWRSGLANQLRALLVQPDDALRLRAYVQRLSEVVAKTPAAQGVSLAHLLPPLLALARERSTGGDATRENRAALIVLTFFANGRSLTALTPAARDWPRPAPRTVTLAGRDDFPKHFLISATLAAEAGTALADAVGLFKEVDDSRGGSGFSFNDIAADRAGTRLGELAVSAPAKLQDALAPGAKEADFMPDVRDLPEFMPEAEFKRRYGGIGAPLYNKMMNDIEARIAARPLYR